MPKLHQLARSGDYEGLKEILESDADARQAIDAVDEEGTTPLFYALNQETPNYEVVKLLLEYGADTGFIRVEKLPVIGDMAEVAADGLESFTESLGIDIKMDFMKNGTQYEEPLLSVALKHGDLDTVKLLHEHDADFSYIYKHGYNSVLNATYRTDEAPEIVEFLIGLGLETDLTSKWGESAIVNAYRNCHFRTVKVLLDAGADDSKLNWTPLIRAVAIGTAGDVLEEVYGDNDPNARDCCDRSALDTTVIKGDVEVFELLLEHAQDEKGLPGGSAILTFAAQGGQAALVEKLVELGHSVNAVGSMGGTALSVAASNGDVEMVRMLLRLGADPEIESFGDTAITEAKDHATILALLEGGADPANLKSEGRRRLVGLGEPNEDPLDSCTKEQYLEFKCKREGNANPDDLSHPFQLAMIRAGVNAYRPRKKFNDTGSIECCSIGPNDSAVWCFDRFGQSFTILLDDRTIFIGGEHEDSYDPDFCIYNDVTVFGPNEEIQLFGYPFSVFEPTDFHTATLVGEEVYIIGGLGYVHQRRGSIPVYRLSTHDFSIERIETSGQVPGRIYEHRAKLIDDTTIRIESGKDENNKKNTETYELDVKREAWAKI